MKKLILARRLSQVFFLCLFIYILWSTTYPLKGIFSPALFFKFNPLVTIITSLSERIILSGVIFSLCMLMLTIILGRFFCGWVCPLGTVIDIVGVFGKSKILTDAQNTKIRRAKFFILGVIFVFSFFSFQIAWIFDPLVIMARFISLNLIPSVTFIIDGFFSWIIRFFHLYGPVYDFYRSLQNSFLGIKVYYFAHSLVIFSFILTILIAAFKLKRSWCRVVCPLGALYAVFSRFSFLERRVKECSHCRKCKSDCRMAAIKDDSGYSKSECILCMDCVYDCPQHVTDFGFKLGAERERQGISRRDFLKLALISSLQGFGFPPGKAVLKKSGRAMVLRPPAALIETEFLNRCIRCGNCMKVCITNGLQPALFQSGFFGIWTPHLVPEIGYCEYHCTLCGKVCPTGAIPELTEEQKLKTRLGLAKIDRSICLPWKKKEQCIVCEEHCPVSNKAIKLKKVQVDGKIIERPYVNLRLCIGCGICQTKCPTRPKRAIIVYPVRVTHS